MIENNQLPFIKRTNTAKGTWNELLKHHKESSFALSIQLSRKLYRQTLPKGANMIEHLAEMMKCYDELYDIGHVIADNQFVLVVLTSVGEDYDNLINVLDCKEEEELTFDLIKCKLISDERKSKHESVEVEEESTNAIANKDIFGIYV